MDLEETLKMDVLFEWFYKFVNTCSVVWDWLISQTDILGMTVRPIFLVCGFMLIAGIVRAIVGVI